MFNPPFILHHSSFITHHSSFLLFPYFLALAPSPQLLMPPTPTSIRVPIVPLVPEHMEPPELLYLLAAQGLKCRREASYTRNFSEKLARQKTAPHMDPAGRYTGRFAQRKDFQR
jgi:hypothetical protein